MKILLAIDESKFSDEALRAVVAQFPPQGNEVRIVHVVQPVAVAPPPQMSADYTPELEDQVKQARERVDRAARTLRTAGFKVDTTVETGDIRLKIIDAAAEFKADLIVVGSHGRSGIPRLLLGSVAEFVVRNAPCSVEVVRTPVKL